MFGTPARLFTASAVLAVAALAVPALLASAPTVARAPGSFELVFDARHVAATIPSNSGVMHTGTFTASAPFCASGTVADLEFQSSNAVIRRYSCADASGSIRVRSSFPGLEHETGAGGGNLRRWKILDGAGRHASLRKQGGWASVRLGGSDDPADFASVTFRATASGIVDLDADAPQIAISRATATKLRRPKGSYLVRVVFSARDQTAGNTVAYRLSVFDNFRQLALKPGTTKAGSVSAALRVRPASRAIKIEIVASDPLGNERTVSRSVRIRR